MTNIFIAELRSLCVHSDRNNSMAFFRQTFISSLNKNIGKTLIFPINAWGLKILFELNVCLIEKGKLCSVVIFADVIFPLHFALLFSQKN